MGLFKSLFGGGDSSQRTSIKAVFVFTTEDLHIDDNPRWTPSDPQFVRFVNDGTSMVKDYVQANPQYSMDKMMVHPKPMKAGPPSEAIRSHLENLARKEYGSSQYIFHSVGGKYGQPLKGFLAVV